MGSAASIMPKHRLSGGSSPVVVPASGGAGFADREAMNERQQLHKERRAVQRLLLGFFIVFLILFVLFAFGFFLKIYPALSPPKSAAMIGPWAASWEILCESKWEAIWG